MYLFIHRDTQRKREKERGREAETQAEGEAGSTQRARDRTRTRASTITPQAAGGTKPLRYRGCPTVQYTIMPLSYLPGIIEKSATSY